MSRFLKYVHTSSGELADPDSVILERELDSTQGIWVKDGSTTAIAGGTSMDREATGVYVYDLESDLYPNITYQYQVKTVTSSVPTYQTVGTIYGAAGKYNQIKNYIKQMLGYSKAHLELDESDYKLITWNALTFFNSFLMKEHVSTVTLVENQHSYTLSEWGHGIHKLTLVSSSETTSPVYFGESFRTAPEAPYSEYIHDRYYQEAMRQALGSSPAWEWDDVNNKLYISMGSGVDPNYYCEVRYFKDHELYEVPSSLFQYIKDISLMYAKERLSQIRGKYGGDLPTPAGGQRLNYDMLQQQAEADKERITEELRSIAQMYLTPDQG